MSWRKGFAAVLLAAAVSAVPAKAAMIAGGSVPLENWFQAQGVEGLNISAAGAAKKLGSIWLNNNAPNSFILTVTERNGGFLRAGLAAAVPAAGVAATSAGTGNPFTAVCNIVDGAAQAAGAVWGPIAVFAPAAFAAFVAGSAGTMTPGAAAVATVNYRVDIDGTWAADATMLAGYYTEVFTISLVAVM
ncbi:MAG TPA: hypothetical protein VJ385_22220 [Fibrobacteria bacterium]|nr:hypothetical protein [Fibrobacteria bacterium]